VKTRPFREVPPAVTPSSDEFAFIDWVRARAGVHPRVPLGIGDDAAVLSFPQKADCLVAVDMLMEGVHFNVPPASLRDVGRKALAVNLSDMAAMAAVPLAAFTSVALPRSRGAECGRELQAGLDELAARYQVAIAGGDTNVWDGPLVISVTVVGEATPRGVVRRAGARAGDWIFVTGSLGGSLEGKHALFEPRVEEALRLHEAAALHAMIDVSDGLAADLHHILDESGVGAELRADAIPISESARNGAGSKTPLERALGDGEDFELLFTVSPDEGRKLLDRSPIALPLAHIGEIVDGRECALVSGDGTRTPLLRQGWEHRF